MSALEALEVGKQLVGPDGQLLLFLQLLLALLHRETCVYRRGYANGVVYANSGTVSHRLFIHKSIYSQLLLAAFCHFLGSCFNITLSWKQVLHPSTDYSHCSCGAVLHCCFGVLDEDDDDTDMRTHVGKKPHDLESERSHSCLI